MVKAYRADLRGNLPGTAGNEAARRRIERWAQSALQSSVLVRLLIHYFMFNECLHWDISLTTHIHQSPVKVHSVSLGKAAPRLSNARIRKAPGSGAMVRFLLRQRAKRSQILIILSSS